MLKQSILIIVLSLIAIFFRAELSHALNLLVQAHNGLSHLLRLIFADDPIGRTIQNVIALLLIPAICGLIVGVGFWLVKRTSMPHIMAVVWVLWMILLVTMLAQTGSAASGRTVINMRHHSTSL